MITEQVIIKIEIDDLIVQIMPCIFQVSVSCGIPDFRSRDGIYARLAVDFPDLPDPQAMFDIEYFRKDPRPFFKFAKVLQTLLLVSLASHEKVFVHIQAS